MNARQKYAGSRRAVMLAAVVVGAGWGVASAQDYASEATPPPLPQTNAWTSQAAVSLTLTRGNSETFLATLSLDAKARWERDELGFGASAGFGEATVNNVNSKNTEFVQGYGQYNHLFNDRIYAGFRMDAQYDGIAGIDYRAKVSPMAGYYLIKNARMTLAVEAGPSLVMEHLSGQEPDSYWAGRFAERFNYKLTTTTSVWESLAYIPKISDWTGNYLLNFETGIETAINKHWSLRVVFQDMYASAPATGRVPNDIRLLAGTGYKF
jgi:putative salt-induced outer membrane protein YdiY